MQNPMTALHRRVCCSRILRSGQIDGQIGKVASAWRQNKMLGSMQTVLMLTTLTQQSEKIKTLVGSSTPASSTALGVDSKPTKSRSKSGRYFKTQKIYCPPTSLLSFWRKIAKWPHRSNFWRHSSFFSKRIHQKSARGGVGGRCGVSPQVWLL